MTDRTSTMAFSLLIGNWPAPLTTDSHQSIFSLPFAVRSKELLLNSRFWHQLTLQGVSPVKRKHIYTETREFPPEIYQGL